MFETPERKAAFWNAFDAFMAARGV
jgi:hypothetical protein